MGVLFFDLDGTLVDPLPGISASVRYAFSVMGAAPPGPEALLRWIGPPARESFNRYFDDPASVERALAAYRAFYGGSAYKDAAPYPGIESLLQRLRAAGATMFVATAKAAPFAALVLQHFGLSEYFAAVFAPDVGGALDDKASLLHAGLEASRAAPELSSMIGDRGTDVRAALVNHVRAIGVTWGYGSREELLSAGATRLHDTPSDLADSLIAEIGRL